MAMIRHEINMSVKTPPLSHLYLLIKIQPEEIYYMEIIKNISLYVRYTKSFKLIGWLGLSYLGSGVLLKKY